MKLTVLCDNYTIIDRYLLGEPALSFYLEDEGQPLLFDTGYSDVFLQNAAALHIDLNRPMPVILSHGHNDHTCGLAAMQRQHLLANKTILAHPAALQPKYIQHPDGKEDVGAPYTAAQLQQCGSALQLSEKPVQLTSRLWFLGQIPRQFAFENKPIPHSYTIQNGEPVPDLLPDDTALVYNGTDGLTIITGCSHSGICNICAYAQQLFANRPIVQIIGGFHLFEVDDRLRQTIEYLQTLQLQALYPCHCVSLPAKIAMAATLPVREVGVGDVYIWD